MHTDFLASADHQFRYYKSLGEKTFAQLTDEQLFWQPNDESNSIATIVKHLWGNMLSRWTDFLTTDGEKPWRERDAEFDRPIASRAEMMEKWNEGWDCVFRATSSIGEADLGRVIHIRLVPHTVLEALHRQLAHYPYHVGQIVWIAKMLTAEAWASLSIPKPGQKAWPAG